MISDQSDEDADALDDDKLLATYLGIDSHNPAQGTVVVPEPLDWPSTTEHDVGLTVDTVTLAWFKTNHTDWQRQMRFVLRAWVMAQTVQASALNDPSIII